MSNLQMMLLNAQKINMHMKKMGRGGWEDKKQEDKIEI